MCEEKSSPCRCSRTGLGKLFIADSAPLSRIPSVPGMTRAHNVRIELVKARELLHTQMIDAPHHQVQYCFLEKAYAQRMAAPDFRTLRYFVAVAVAVAEERSVGKAARRLRVHTMRSFQRAKEALLPANEGFDAARAIGSGSRGGLMVGTMVVLSYLVLPCLKNALRAKLPDVEIQLWN